MTDEWGIDDRYSDVQGRSHATSKASRAALTRSMRGPDRGRYADVRVVPVSGATSGAASGSWRPDASGTLWLEDGSRQRVDRGGSIELPAGYHDFKAEGSDDLVRLIASPGRCHLPDDLRVWGWATQLYATRSRRSWGIGDLGDLRDLGRWAVGLGAAVTMINPLSAATPVLPLEASPYYPSSRRFRNPIYLRIEDVPGADAVADDLRRLEVSGRNLNSRRRIERDAVFALKMEALDRCFLAFERGPRGPRDAFARYRAEQAQALDTFAIFCTIAERQGKDWRQWPEALRRPDAPGVAELASRWAPRVAFHAWLQWLLDQQLARAAAEIGIIQDLPIGIDVAGADAWCWQDLLAEGVSVGVPPDELNPAGQDWGLTPFIPRRLRAAGYQPIIETLRATLRHAAGLRIDHVMGLFRLFWIPHGLGPGQGAFVRTRADELLAIIALESVRARAFVVGEDLGTVEPGVRERMADCRMLSYRLLSFESDPPARFPDLALSSVTTHDLPTIAGLWTGADQARTAAAGVQQNQAGLRALRERMAVWTDRAAEPSQVIADVYGALATAPSRVLLATLDDALAVEERPNTPGAGVDWPNWALALPLPLEDFDRSPLPRTIADALSRR